MNAIKFLIKEHDKVRKILKNIPKKSRRYVTKKAMFKNLCKDLIIHEAMEQKVWYPHFKKSKKIKSEVKHLLSEEKHAEIEIKKFKAIKSEEEWDKRFLKFKIAVENHAYEEEHKLFPNVKNILTEEELNAIGSKMRKFRNKFKKKTAH